MTALYTSRMAYPKRRLWIESCVGISGKIGEDAIMDGPRTFHLLTKSNCNHKWWGVKTS